MAEVAVIRESGAVATWSHSLLGHSHSLLRTLHNALQNALYSTHCTMHYTTHCTKRATTVHSHSLQRTLHNALYSTHCTMYYTMHCTQRIAQCTTQRIVENLRLWKTVVAAIGCTPYLATSTLCTVQVFTATVVASLSTIAPLHHCTVALLQ